MHFNSTSHWIMAISRKAFCLSGFFQIPCCFNIRITVLPHLHLSQWCWLFFKKLEDSGPLVGLLIPLFWISGNICSEFQSQSDSLACALCYLLMIYSTVYPLVQQLPTFLQPAWQASLSPTYLFKHSWKSNTGHSLRETGALSSGVDIVYRTKTLRQAECT